MQLKCFKDICKAIIFLHNSNFTLSNFKEDLIFQIHSKDNSTLIYRFFLNLNDLIITKYNFIHEKENILQFGFFIRKILRK